MINETAQLINQGNAYVSSLITMWLSFLIIFPLFTWFVKSKNSKWGKFWIVYFSVMVATGILLSFLISSPDKFIGFISSVGNFTN